MVVHLDLRCWKGQAKDGGVQPILKIFAIAALHLSKTAGETPVAMKSCCTKLEVAEADIEGDIDDATRVVGKVGAQLARNQILMRGDARHLCAGSGMGHACPRAMMPRSRGW